MATQLFSALAQLLFSNHIQHRVRRGYRQRVTGIGSAQAAWRWGIHHLGATNDARQRETAGEAFRHRHQIRFHIIVLHGEQLAGTGETGLHFIGDQQNAVGIAQIAQRLHEIGWRDVKAAFPWIGSRMMAATGPAQYPL